MFQPAGKVKKSLKIAVYGEPGTGKTWFGLLAEGRKAVIDTENGTDFYGSHFDFDVVKTRLYSEVVKALDYIERNPSKYDVLIIDPITNIYQTLKDAGQLSAERRARKYNRSAEDVVLTFRDWGVIKNKYNSLISRLCNLPCHVVITGWLKDVYEGQGDNMRKVGSRLDADKKTEYQPDVIIRMEVDQHGNRYGVIEKDRTMTYRVKQRVKDISFNDFLGAVNPEGSESKLQLDDEAAAAEAEITEGTVEAIKAEWLRQRLNPQALEPQIRKLYQVGLHELTEAQGEGFLDKLKGQTEEPKNQPVTQDIPKEPTEATITKKQIGAIHTIAKEKGIDESERRAIISKVSNGRTKSSKDLTVQEASQVIEEMKGKAERKKAMLDAWGQLKEAQ